MVVLVFFHEDVERRRRYYLIWRNDSRNHVLDVRHQRKCNDTIDQEFSYSREKDHIIEEMEGLQFKVGPKSFYQTNSEQAYNLYKVAREFAVLPK